MMESNKKDKVGIEEETIEGKRDRSVTKACEVYDLEKKGWEETKARLRGGQSSVVEQDVIDNLEVLEDFDDIEYLGEEGEDDYGSGIDKGKQKLTSIEGDDRDDSDDKEESDSRDEEDNRLDDDNASDDMAYLGQTSSCDTDESVFDDFEFGQLSVDSGSSDDDEELGPELEHEPPQEVTALQEAEASSTRPFFTVGMTYEDKKELKRAIDKYAISRGVNLKIVRSDKKTLKVICEDGCPFSLYASTYGLSIGFQVKSLYDEHNCARVYDNPRASSMWLAEKFKEKVQESPKFKTTDMKKEVQRELKVNVSIHKCKRAKRKIMKEMEGSFKDEFGKLEAYCNELKISNPGSDVSVELSTEALEHGRRVFKRMYLSFNASKVGWKAGCRPLVGVDGTFLKGESRGILLTAVGLDGNDSLYPLAFGLVEKENELQWTWFLEWIRISLDLGNGEYVTLMSDMQKGLVNAVSKVLPRAEHRLCARHIYANWSKKWRGNEFKKKFFSCAWSTFEEEFKDNLNALGSLRKEAAVDAVTYNVNAWVRAYFSTRCKSWLVDNNLSESLNAWIDEYRFLPVIRMFDGIRLKMMTKWAESEINVRNWSGGYSPKCIELFEANRYLAVNCRVYFNGDEGYEVTEGQDRHSVQLSRSICTCRAWDLTGIPCQHAIYAMYHAKVDPKSHISHYYHKDTYLASYRSKLQPVRGKKFWDTQTFLPMQPPPTSNLPGRPQKKRKRTEEADRRRKKYTPGSVRPPSNAPQPQLQRLTRRGKIHKCSVCNKEGHNKSTCQEAPAASRPQNKKKNKSQPSENQPVHLQTSQDLLDDTQSSQQPPQPSQEEPTQPTKRAVTRKCYYKSRVQCGMGVRFDETTGRTVYNPGLNSEMVLDEGTSLEYMRHYADPQTKFPIPNERDIRMSRLESSGAPTGSRSIQFSRHPMNIAEPSNLPFQPPGLQWKGQPCVTQSQLLAQTQSQLLKRSHKSKEPTI